MKYFSAALRNPNGDNEIGNVNHVNRNRFSFRADEIGNKHLIDSICFTMAGTGLNLKPQLSGFQLFHKHSHHGTNGVFSEPIQDVVNDLSHESDTFDSHIHVDNTEVMKFVLNFSQPLELPHNDSLYLDIYGGDMSTYSLKCNIRGWTTRDEGNMNF